MGSMPTGLCPGTSISRRNRSHRHGVIFATVIGTAGAVVEYFAATFGFYATSFCLFVDHFRFPKEGGYFSAVSFGYFVTGIGSFQVAQTNTKPGSVSGDHVNQRSERSSLRRPIGDGEDHI